MFWVYFSLFLVSCGAAATTGAMFDPGKWYDGLNKPSWNPPKWMFPVTWTTLYLCMSVAGARVAGIEGAALPLVFWAMQIAFNTLWTPVFFGLRRMRAALIIIIFLWLAVLGAMVTHWQVDQIAGLLFVPYLAWVSVAAALNLSVLRLNPDASAD
ncbi:tryptophan-rich sensory protein TspO [Pseudaestuariivita atlantica]|uniref:CrtK n=1 Tax=Pseudaestuariivita atlantica TaxID=1317121 RepID=A0A0L1JQN4_9RHOB|nr:TspO/MBR family protein [Pseudaestuariivita atlantica]KNG93728.1 CrtK [Pseudaestuariivita atlantica]